MSVRAKKLTSRVLRRWGLPDPGASKYDRGTVLVAGGARRTPGAAILAGTAALRVREASLEVASRYGAAVATQSLVADPAGTAWTFDAGGPGLGTSGSGDVLAGAVAGFAARGVPPVNAAAWATYVHAAAGDALAHGTHGVGYLARELPGMFADIIADVLGGQ